MKRFEIDTNFNWFGPNTPAVYPFLLGGLDLKPGDRVVVFQDDDEWTATVAFDPSVPEQYQWYVILD